METAYASDGLLAKLVRWQNHVTSVKARLVFCNRLGFSIMLPPALQQTFDLAVQHHSRRPAEGGRTTLSQGSRRESGLHRGIPESTWDFSPCRSGAAIAVDLLPLRCWNFGPAIPTRPNNFGNAASRSGAARSRQYRRLPPTAHGGFPTPPWFTAISATRWKTIWDGSTRRLVFIAPHRQLDPAYPEAHNNLGVALRSQGHLKEAIAAFQQAIALNPRYAIALCQSGRGPERRAGDLMTPSPLIAGPWRSILISPKRLRQPRRRLQRQWTTG